MSIIGERPLISLTLLIPTLRSVRHLLGADLDSLLPHFVYMILVKTFAGAVGRRNRQGKSKVQTDNKNMNISSPRGIEWF